ncbi:DUF948 domain-containing protein [Planococcus dechangensis]|uniref:DUF948 domain-containing protein n=1 Tax=Planococcus dechangensis TaxID=1176255 RepID=A0ABV9MBA5_9BACL
MDPIIWLYIAIGIIVLGLVVAAIGAFLLIKGMKEPMKEMKGSADNLKGRVDKLMLETTHLQHTTAELKEDIQQKTEKITYVIDAAKGTKNSVLDMNAVVRNITAGISTKVDHDPAHAAQVNQWSNTAVGLLSYLDKNKAPVQSNTHYNPEPDAIQQPPQSY